MRLVTAEFHHIRFRYLACTQKKRHDTSKKRQYQLQCCSLSTKTVTPIRVKFSTLYITANTVM